MSEIFQIPSNEFDKFLSSSEFLYEPHVSTIDHKVGSKVEHFFSMRIIVPKGKKLLCHKHHEANPINRTTELHLYYYSGTAPSISNLNSLVFPHPIPITIGKQPFDLYLALFTIEDFGIRGDERLWPKIKLINDLEPKGHDGTVHLPGLGD